QFERNKITEQIPDKTSNAVYADYYDYESNENGLYAYFIGCKVEENTQAPEKLDELILPDQNYRKVTAKGQTPGCIAEAWIEIWHSGIDRKFGFDFEIYDERSRDWENAAVHIFISVIG